MTLYDLLIQKMPHLGEKSVDYTRPCLLTEEDPRRPKGNVHFALSPYDDYGFVTIGESVGWKTKCFRPSDGSVLGSTDIYFLGATFHPSLPIALAHVYPEGAGLIDLETGQVQRERLPEVSCFGFTATCALAVAGGEIFSADLIASGGPSGDIEMTPFKSLKAPKALFLDAQEGYVFSPDGSLLATVREQEIVVWDLRRNKEKIRLTQADVPPLAELGLSPSDSATAERNRRDLRFSRLAFSADSRRLVVGVNRNGPGALMTLVLDDGTVASSRTRLPELGELQFTPDGTHVLAGHAEGALIFNARTLEPVQKLEGAAWPSITVSHDGRVIHVCRNPKGWHHKKESWSFPARGLRPVR